MVTLHNSMSAQRLHSKGDHFWDNDFRTGLSGALHLGSSCAEQQDTKRNANHTGAMYSNFDDLSRGKGNLSTQGSRRDGKNSPCARVLTHRENRVPWACCPHRTGTPGVRSKPQRA